jgi:hypothetical protein
MRDNPVTRLVLIRAKLDGSLFFHRIPTAVIPSVRDVLRAHLGEGKIFDDGSVA